MSTAELFILAVGLSMDAFAVAVCKGLSMPKMNWGHGIVIGLYFGLFQALMPVAGYLLGMGFRGMIESVDHWVAFLLLAMIGLNMIKEARSGEEASATASIRFKEMVVLAIATSIDALAVGVTFAFLQVDVLPAVCSIGAVTFLLSCLGVKAGNLFGSRFRGTAELAGGMILILIGLKILLEHLGILHL